MRHHKLVTIAAVALALLAGGRSAYAQERYEFNIPFSFMANGKNLPAGDYFLYADDVQQVLTVESKTVKANIVALPIETRIAEIRPQAEAELVFDKLNDKSYVSELLAPGQDGYVLLVTKPKHTHHSLKGAHVKK
jgi:hypothetical protein